VKIYDNQIEFFNPGRLPEGLTIEKLLKGEYISVVRNRKIADIFKEVGLIEKYGTGIRRILTGFKSYGLPAPKFEEFNGGFRVTVYKQARQLAPAEVTAQVGTKYSNL
jgi:ATP-dependent DNA helicase RecG